MAAIRQNARQPVAVQLCSLPASLVSQLSASCVLVPLFAMSASEQDAALKGTASAATIAITSGRTGCSNALLQALPELRLMAVFGVGHDGVDSDLLRRRGIVLATTPGVLDDDVADLATGVIFALLRGIPAADDFVRRGAWPASSLPLGTRVAGKKFGIVGLGRIGSAIARRLEPLGRIAYTGPRKKAVEWTYHSDVVALAAASDVLIVACSAQADTFALINAAVLKALGPSGYLINIARGSVVDEQALMAALEDLSIAGAALDVFVDEPNVPSGLQRAGRTVLTPHIGSATHEGREAMAALLLANVHTFLAGEKPPGIVDL